MKKKITLVISILILILLITISITYAYFSANITGGEDDTTITVTGGTMSIHYNGGANIEVSDIIPSNIAFGTKIFTVTGNNTMDIEMYYEVSLVVEENTFSETALKYKLLGTNTNNNGLLIDSITELTNIGSGAKKLSLGVGNFDVPTNGDKVHTYNLELYFPDTNESQNINQGKTFKAHVEINSTNKPPLGTLNELIIAQGGGIDTIEARGIPDFNDINTASSIYSTEDDYGKSYYYRGLKDELNNNLLWGGFQWKIVRINGDGTVRIVYNGTEEQFNSNKTMNSTGVDTLITSTPWNDNSNDTKYLGYMYGGANGIASSQRDGNISSAATYNETDTNMKKTLDNWYVTNIENVGLSHMIADNLFCNDRQLQSEVGGAATGPGFGGVVTNYAAYNRLFTNKNPDLKCVLQNDQFTVKPGVLGNGALTYPVGLLTADEASLAGLVYSTNNFTNYLFTGISYFLLSPHNLNHVPFTIMFYVTAAGQLNGTRAELSQLARPSISMISSAIVESGTGSNTDPFIIK